VRSLPGLGLILGVRVLSEFGDDPTRFDDVASRRAYAGAAPITRAPVTGPHTRRACFDTRPDLSSGSFRASLIIGVLGQVTVLLMFVGCMT